MASIVATAASIALPPDCKISSPAAAPRGWPVATAAEFAMIWRGISTGRPRTLTWADFSKRRARDSNSQPLAGHHISSVAASHSLTLRRFALRSIVTGRGDGLKAEGEVGKGVKGKFCTTEMRAPERNSKFLVM